MTRQEIYELAQCAEKGNWRTYSKLKSMLDERLSTDDYAEFCTRLAEILEV